MQKYMRISDVANYLCTSKATIYNWIKTEDFPKQIKLTEKVSLWCVDDLDEWVNSKRGIFDS